MNRFEYSKERHLEMLKEILERNENIFDSNGNRTFNPECEQHNNFYTNRIYYMYKNA